MAVTDRAQYGPIVYRGIHVTARFKLNRAGIRKCANGPELRASCHAAAAKAEAYAKGISPTGEEEGGHYRNKFELDDTHVTITDRSGRYPMRRVATVLINRAVYAAVVEVGGKNPQQPAQRILLKTLKFLEATSGGASRAR